MAEIFAKIGLLFGQPMLLISVSIIGLIFFDRRIFERVLLLLFFTMIYNLVLKNYFSVPLPPTLDKPGFAYPSGHMHSAVVFWGWLMIESRRFWLWPFYLMICALMSYGLIYHGYHYPKDTFAAFGFGGFTLAIFYLANQLHYFEVNYRHAIYLLPTASTLMYLLPEGQHFIFIKQAYTGIITVSVLSYLFSKGVETKRSVQLLILLSTIALSCLAWAFLPAILSQETFKLVMVVYILSTIYLSTYFIPKLLPENKS